MAGVADEDEVVLRIDPRLHFCAMHELPLIDLVNTLEELRQTVGC
jgi:hypothetical protein